MSCRHRTGLRTSPNITDQTLGRTSSRWLDAYALDERRRRPSDPWTLVLYMVDRRCSPSWHTVYTPATARLSGQAHAGAPPRARGPLTPLYPSQLTCSVTFCFCGVEQGGRHSYSGRSRWPGRWVICKICNTTLFTILSILPFSLILLKRRRVFSRPEDGLAVLEEVKGVSHCI